MSLSGCSSHTTGESMILRCWLATRCCCSLRREMGFAIDLQQGVKIWFWVPVVGWTRSEKPVSSHLFYSHAQRSTYRNSISPFLWQKKNPFFLCTREHHNWFAGNNFSTQKKQQKTQPMKILTFLSLTPALSLAFSVHSFSNRLATNTHLSQLQVNAVEVGFDVVLALTSWMETNTRFVLAPSLVVMGNVSIVFVVHVSQKASHTYIHTFFGPFGIQYPHTDIVLLIPLGFTRGSRSRGTVGGSIFPNGGNGGCRKVHYRGFSRHR